MNTKELGEIKEKIERKKSQKSKAEALIEKTESDWKKEYGFSTLPKAEEKLEELKSELSDKQKEQNKLMEDLEAVTDWSAL